jgi:hypothetical protein
VRISLRRAWTSRPQPCKHESMVLPATVKHTDSAAPLTSRMSARSLPAEHPPTPPATSRRLRRHASTNLLRRGGTRLAQTTPRALRLTAQRGSSTFVMELDAGCFAPLPVPPLPHALVLYIFSLVPLDQRLRCLEVCKGWYATLNERSLWTRLDLSATAGLARPATDALLRAAAARAGGQLEALHLTDCVAITHDALMRVVRGNADTLTELRMEGSCGLRYNLYGSFALVGDIEAVLGAAPRLRLLAADVGCTEAAEAHRLLRNEDVFAALRVRKLAVTVHDEPAVLALAGDLAAHTWLTEVNLQGAPLRTLAMLDAVVDAALALRLRLLTLFRCNLTPASAPALARLIRGSALRELYVFNKNQQLLDEPAAAVTADALRANSTLTSLQLLGCGLWRDAAGAALLLDALTAHRSLRTLDLSINIPQPPVPAVAAALGALVAANAPALQELHVSASGLRDAGLGALVDALPHNTHLRTLHLAENHCTEAFTHDRLLPAVRANTSLQHLAAVDVLAATDGVDRRPFAHEAEAFVNARRAAAP